MSETSSRYIHGTSAEEQLRLSRLNDILNADSIRELALRPGETALDLGCGLGQLTRLMARAAGPTGRVVGVDRSAEQLAEARRLAREAGEADLAELRLGEVVPLDLAPDERGSFDVVHTRFLLEHVPDPLAVVRAMVEAARPGGRIVLQDEDHELLRVAPAPETFAELWGSYIRSYERVGNDPRIGRRLVSLLHQAGATPRRSTMLFFGGCASEPRFPALHVNLIEILRGARATILEADLLDPARFDAGIEELGAWGRKPDAAIWYVLSWAEGVKPA